MTTIPKDALKEIGLADGVFSHIERLMHLFGLAEELADRYQAQRPDRPTHQWLKYMVPDGEMMKLVDGLFVAHCAELFERGIAFIDEQEKERGYKVFVPRGAMGRVMARGTAAEALLVLVKTSEAVPLHNDPASLYIELFKRCFPDLIHSKPMQDVFKVDGIHLHRESFPGHLAQLEDEIRTKCTRDRDPEYTGKGERVQRWDPEQWRGRRRAARAVEPVVEPVAVNWVATQPALFEMAG